MGKYENSNNKPFCWCSLCLETYSPTQLETAVCRKSSAHLQLFMFRKISIPLSIKQNTMLQNMFPDQYIPLCHLVVEFVTDFR